MSFSCSLLPAQSHPRPPPHFPEMESPQSLLRFPDCLGVCGIRDYLLAQFLFLLKGSLGFYILAPYYYSSSQSCSQCLLPYPDTLKSLYWSNRISVHLHESWWRALQNDISICKTLQDHNAIKVHLVIRLNSFEGWGHNLALKCHLVVQQLHYRRFHYKEKRLLIFKITFISLWGKHSTQI